MKVSSGQFPQTLIFPLNFVDPSISWPPPDPDRIPRKTRNVDQSQGFTYSSSISSNEDYIKAFRQRQQEDFKRFTKETSTITRRRLSHEPYEIHENGKETFLQHSMSSGKAGEEVWRNTDGDRLDDFGVDENAELYDEDEIPAAAFLKHQEKALFNNSTKQSAS